MEQVLETPLAADDNAGKNSAKEGYRNFLKSILLFSGFTDACIGKVLDKARVKKYQKNQSLFFIGDKADFFYIIVDGWVKLFRETRDGHESVVAMLTNGEMFGRSAVLKNGSYPYSGEVVTNAELLIIPSDFMLYMAEHHTSFDHFLSKFLESGLSVSNQKGLEAEHLAKMTSAQRVGCFMLKMCGEKREGSISLHFPYEKSLVAGRLGMTPETFSRSLNQLNGLGVETNNSMVTIHNIEQLKINICEHCSATRKECSLAEDD